MLTQASLRPAQFFWDKHATQSYLTQITTDVPVFALFNGLINMFLLCFYQHLLFLSKEYFDMFLENNIRIIWEC